MSYFPTLPTLYCGVCIPKNTTPFNQSIGTVPTDLLLLNATDSPPFKAMQIIDDLT